MRFLTGGGEGAGEYDGSDGGVGGRLVLISCTLALRRLAGGTGVRIVYLYSVSMFALFKSNFYQKIVFGCLVVSFCTFCGGWKFEKSHVI